MHSPSKNSYPKKTRKNTFSQAAIIQSEVGDFHGGYFVMPDAYAIKENNPPKTKNSHKAERSPARRKLHVDSATLSSPIKERIKIDVHTCKKPQSPPVEIILNDCGKEMLLTPGSFSVSNTKLALPVPSQQLFEYSCVSAHNGLPPCSPNKDFMSTSPPSSGRWAGPAFGNAPHPSTLPLPEWTSECSLSSHSILSSSPPVHDGGFYHQGMAYQAHSYPQSPPVTRSDIPLSSIPAVPFPYVDSVSPTTLPSPSLAQLSTDLRRMLNINGGPIVNMETILVSANSS